ncbi:hypothetical protein [Novosphingobium sp.]|uniref:hypothetical protein n=1 Tax=Novosphingobium sp. TaxID=1874826 RepID=UPI0025FA9744|nr:hypothetical protein [Novosphingobium sp.]MCC6926513.1 hypothetical protein [Novosphingobium sp.]
MNMLLDWQKLGLFAAIAAVAAHVCMFKLQSRPKVHKLAVYASALIGGCSLLLGLYQSDEQLAKWARPSLELNRKAELSMLTMQIESDRQYFCESPKAVRTEYSPSNFDQIVAAETAACGTMKTLKARSGIWESATNDISLPELKAEHFAIAMPQQSARELLRLAKAHNVAAAEVRRLDSMGSPSALLLTLTAFGPYAFILAFTVGLASIWFPASAGTAKTAGLRRKRKAREAK